MIKEAIIEQWRERFGVKKPLYSENKITEIEKCTTIDKILSHTMNIDLDGRNLIADKIQISHRDFAFFLSAYRALAQGYICEGGTTGFHYKLEVNITEDQAVVKTEYISTFADETTSTFMTKQKNEK